MKTRSFLYVAIVYAGATAAAFASLRAFAPLGPVAALALATLAGTTVVFVGSLRANNSSVYDPYWSVFPPGALAFFLSLAPALTPRAILVVAVTALWAARLTWNWARGWEGLRHEDWRYVDIRRKTGRWYWPAAYAGIHFFPTVLTYLGSLPALPACTSAVPFGAVDVLGGLVALGAIAIEAIADEQLRAYRRGHPTGACDVGLWRYSRHPNYFGEILFWVGVWILGVAAGAPTWMAVGPVAMVALFQFASIPLAEKHALLRRPEYAQRIATVSRLVPWFPRKPRSP